MEPAKSIFRKLEDLLSHLRQTFPRKTDVFSRDPTFSKTVILLSHIFMHVFFLSVSHTARCPTSARQGVGPRWTFSFGVTWGWLSVKGRSRAVRAFKSTFFYTYMRSVASAIKRLVH